MPVTIDWGALLVVTMTAVLGWLTYRGLNDSKAAREVADGAAALIKPLNDRIEALEKRVTKQGAWMSKAAASLKIAEKQVRGLGHEPLWQIEPFEE